MTTKTIYRVEGLIANIDNQLVDFDETFYFENQQAAKSSFIVSWAEATEVTFVKSNWRPGCLNAIGTLYGQQRLLGRIVPQEQAEVVHQASIHF